MTLQAIDPIYVDFGCRSSSSRAILHGSDRHSDHRCLSGVELRGQGHRHRSARRLGDPQLPGGGHGRQSRPPAAARHVRAGRRAVGRRAALPDAAADGDHLQPVRRDGVHGAEARPAAPARLVAQQVFVTLGPTRGDQVAVLSGIKRGRSRGDQRPAQAEERHAADGGQQRAAAATIRTRLRRNSERRAMKFTDLFVERPVLSAGREPADPGAGPARYFPAAGHPISADGERDRHRQHDLLRCGCRTRSRDSSLSRSSGDLAGAGHRISVLLEQHRRRRSSRRHCA